MWIAQGACAHANKHLVCMCTDTLFACEQAPCSYVHKHPVQNHIISKI